MAAMVYDSDLRTLNESELVYKISNRKDVNFNEESTFEDFIQQLTPGRKETALAVIELYTRMKAKKTTQAAFSVHWIFTHSCTPSWQTLKLKSHGRYS